MTTSPKLARKRFAKIDHPSVAKMGTVLNSNVAPKFPLTVELLRQFDHNSRAGPQTLSWCKPTGGVAGIKYLNLG
jgi:hypothetical protein